MEKIRLYQPSNGSEGDWFKSQFCYECAKCPIDPGSSKQCGIMIRTMLHYKDDKEYPNQWRYVDGVPVCTSFKSRDEYNAERREKRKPASDKFTPDLFN